MNRQRALQLAVMALLWLLVSAQQPASAEEPAAQAMPVATDTVVDGEDDEEGFVEELSWSEAVVETHEAAEVSAGYRFLAGDGQRGAAAPYDDFRSGPVLGARYSLLGKEHKFQYQGVFVTDDDYLNELGYDYRGILRLHLRNESFRHNTEHLELFAPAFSLGGIPYAAVDTAPGRRYDVRVGTDDAHLRYKLAPYPLHFNLEYWRILRDGEQQLIYADQGFESGPNTIYSRTRLVDNQSQEVVVSADGHFGIFDLIYEARFRQFDNYAPVARDLFVARAGERAGGLLQHNDVTESRYQTHTVKLHTTLTGGIIAGASYSYGLRENRSGLSDVRGADESRTTLQNLAGDFVYTPCREFSLALKYRRQEIERDLATNLLVPSLATPQVSVRPGLDSTRDVLTSTMSLRPLSWLTVKGEYQVEFTERDNAAAWTQAGVVATAPLPEHSVQQTATLALMSRAIHGLRLKAQYRYTTLDNPDYGTSATRKHDSELLAAYNGSKGWGAVFNLHYTDEKNDRQQITTLPLFVPSVTYQLPWDRQTTMASGSVWVAPMERLTLSADYSLLHQESDRTVLFMGVTPGGNVASRYHSQGQVCGLTASYRLPGEHTLSLQLQEIRNASKFAPQDVTISATENSAGITEISHVRSRQRNIGSRLDLRLAQNISCTVDYRYQAYRDEYQGENDGTAHFITTQLVWRW